MFIFRCVIVLLHPKKNRQTHIINTSRYVSLLEPLKSSASLAADVMRFTCVVCSRKPFSALAFSHDGKHLVTGEVRDERLSKTTITLKPGLFQ